MPSPHQILALLALTGASLAGASPMLSRDHDDRCSDVEPGFPIGLVAAQAQIVSTHSWEYGTAAEALLELCASFLLLYT